MENRTVKELIEEILKIYQNYSIESLRNQVYYWKKINDVRVEKDAPTEPLIHYCQGSLNGHAIELRVPGYLTFRNRETRQKEKEIQTYDVRIRLVKNKKYTTPKHVSVVEDLFQKLDVIENQDERLEYYNLLTYILVNIYTDKNVMNGITLTDELQEWDRNWGTTYSLVELINFIKWCAAQEALNYCQPEDWGMDLSFARYFEALAAGLEQNHQLLECIKKRTENHKQGKPKLWNQEIYFGLLNHRY